MGARRAVASTGHTPALGTTYLYLYMSIYRYINR